MDEQQHDRENASPEGILEELRATFREESSRLVEELGRSLHELEKRPGDREQIERAFRLAHTLKGSASACEYDDIVAFSHELEMIFGRIRSGKASATKEILDAAVSARDQIKTMLDRYYRGGSLDEKKASGV